MGNEGRAAYRGQSCHRNAEGDLMKENLPVGFLCQLLDSFVVCTVSTGNGPEILSVIGIRIPYVPRTEKFLFTKKFFKMARHKFCSTISAIISIWSTGCEVASTSEGLYDSRVMRQ
jgi:hypothetical protein